MGESIGPVILSDIQKYSWYMFAFYIKPTLYILGKNIPAKRFQKKDSAKSGGYLE